MGMWGVGKENDGSRDRDRRRRARLERATRSWASDPRALRVGLKRMLGKLGLRASKRMGDPSISAADSNPRGLIRRLDG